MVARAQLKARPDVRAKIARVLRLKHREHFGSEAQVRVEDRGYKNYLNLEVVSPGFRSLDLLERTRLVWKWLRDGLSPSEHNRIVSLGALTPAEARERWGDGR